MRSRSHLYGEEEGPGVDEGQVHADPAVGAGPAQGDEVGDAEQGDDDQQGLGRLPMLVMLMRLPLGGGLMRLRRVRPQLGDHHPHDPDEEEEVQAQNGEDGRHVNDLHGAAAADEGAAGRRGVGAATQAAVEVKVVHERVREGASGRAANRDGRRGRRNGRGGRDLTKSSK